jgi:hypothetical protein
MGKKAAAGRGGGGGGGGGGGHKKTTAAPVSNFGLPQYHMYLIDRVSFVVTHTYRELDATG